MRNPFNCLCNLQSFEEKLISVDRLLPNTDHTNPPMKAYREAAAMRCVDRDVVIEVCEDIGDGCGVKTQCLVYRRTSAVPRHGDSRIESVDNH
ncbi:hypothetical protein K443DRAFT_685312 [Laccaria amethystina LaAM-08-1]|uniref:Uncharacterized protein n=1 Tax=Laccaria amethystina LaAM-08-1 TaxID=1095629 RepID=A0A0C9X3U9_9AGAR|nr:hypothetical protein K443DRAFT_685312 [Laccaria amethystina LaAM-08-1]